MHRLRVIILILLLTPVASALAQSSGTPIILGPAAPIAPAVITRDATGRATLRTMRTPSPLNFDGRLDEAFYKDTPSFGDFVQ